MFVSIRFAAFRPLLATVLTLPLLLTGCTQDVVTFANKSREEGMLFYNEKAYSDAAGAFRNAIRQDPRDARSHFYLGVCYDELKQHQQAFSQYRTALEVLKQTHQETTDTEFYEMILDTLAGSIARYDEGETELNKAEARAKGSQVAEDWFILAKIYRQRGDADRAIDAYKRAARWDTADFHPRKELGLYLLEPLNQTQEAEYWLRQAYRLEPNDESLNAGLEKLGITPNPSYKTKDEPARRVGPYTPAQEPPQQRAGGHLPAAGTAQTPRD